ncbi:pao retrotransposon peptidase [Labeo rohita]|uniref:Pao retrotransposon peptidase n=1 Tax=Labeo rohita TaxID=84645 RepID=A0A498NVG2_LABRO|nr:pao retrotransposon peptidase [Labeo rohita]
MQDIETEVNKEDPVIDRLRELSALLSEKVETLLELDVGIKEGTDTDDLENEIADVEEYKERVITAKSRAHQVIQRNRESSRPSGTEAQHAVSCIKIQPAKQNNNVLLQTVRACAEGPAGHRSIRCLLDGGSQRRFITPVTAKRNTVKVTLKNVWQKIEIKALETPQVCTAVMKIPGLKRQLQSDLVLRHRYNEVVNDYLEQGIVEDVAEEDSSLTAVKYYMPHHTVHREDKVTTKLRVVFDASSHDIGSPSLNHCLLTGPYLNPDLLSTLINFRLHAIAFTADIKKAFLQISLAEKDRDAVRFLWLAAPLHENRGEKPRVLQMMRVVFGVSPSPFLLAATVRKHLKKYETQLPEVVKIIKESSASDVEKAFSITANAKQIMSTASMDLCKWTTNSPELKEKWKTMTAELAPETETPGAILKVLGLVWRTETDDFVFDLTALLDAVAKRENTKSFDNSCWEPCAAYPLRSPLLFGVCQNKTRRSKDYK